MRFESVWQEFDCPKTRVDTDLVNGEIVHVGEEIHCIHCGQTHVATEEMFGYVDVKLEDGTYTTRPMPANAAQKAALLAELINPVCGQR